MHSAFMENCAWFGFIDLLTIPSVYGAERLFCGGCSETEAHGDLGRLILDNFLQTVGLGSHIV